jgi:hypothetical protein
MRGITGPLNASAAAPVLDGGGGLAGVVSLGFALDNQDFVDRLKKMTGCEIGVFLGDERVASTFSSRARSSSRTLVRMDEARTTAPHAAVITIMER